MLITLSLSSPATTRILAKDGRGPPVFMRIWSTRECLSVCVYVHAPLINRSFPPSPPRSIPCPRLPPCRAHIATSVCLPTSHDPE